MTSPVAHNSCPPKTPAADVDAFLTDCLALDLEISKSGDRVRQIGAVHRGRTFAWSGGKETDKALAELNAFGCRASFVLGHNLLNHDLPFLKAVAPESALLKLPVIDTLFLSPLAFPRNPYHRLVKDYKLVRSSVSDPLEDIRLALALFRDEWQSLGQTGDVMTALRSFYAYCFRQARLNGFDGHGLAGVFDVLGTEPVESAIVAADLFTSLIGDNACANAVEHGSDHLLTRPENLPAAAYSLAWLVVAGSNSVLPPWVRHQFPGVAPLLRQLRDVPCDDRSCAYCRATHDPDGQLKRFFGFDCFREKPQTSAGESLQRTVVLNGLRDVPLLAIMPTGGGKSLCYQLPALVRHMRRGLLTVVISPLQALMKDQVDNLVRNTGTPFAAAIYGLLTPPERGEVIERVRLGDIAILYLSPEQLRSRSVRTVLAQREIGCWVFDEAHCLSKWGHDFRPDYIYAARFIREFAHEQHQPLPPIACFTATAKPDVIEEIREYFHGELKQTLQLFEGGVQRDNLNFEIWRVNASEKLERTLEIVRHHIQGDAPAGAIVYAAKRRTTEAIRDYLVHQGVLAEAFHGGLEVNAKRRIIEGFVGGEIPVICATNAFGMGIDKENIRLVLHYDIPGSLENYIQEAGRAGRDLQPATCILLYDPEDAETQFRLGAMSEIKKDEIQHILRCLKKHGKRCRDNDIVITTQELLREEDLAGVFEKADPGGDTKIRTAVSWLERADFLQRNQNLTQVFQGRPLVRAIEQADPTIERLNLSPLVQRLWRGILLTMFNAPADRGLGADEIAESLFASADTLRKLEHQFSLTPAQIVLHAMHDMAVAGLLDEGMMLSAYVKLRGRNRSFKVLQSISDMEERMLKLLQEEAPDAAIGDWLDLDIGRVNQRLKHDCEASNPLTIRNLIKGMAYDGTGLAGSHGSIELFHVSRNRYRATLRRTWKSVLETAALRRGVAQVILRELVDKANRELAAAGNESAGEILVAFSANELTDAIGHDILLHTNVQKPLAAVDRALMFLHENKVIILQNGLAVFRQAMTIRLNSYDQRRNYTVGDFKPLALHYRERRFQVHVIMEYANLAMEKVARALGLVLDYFSMSRERFTKKYFSDREDILRRATSAESYRRIVESLNHPVQMAIVSSPMDTCQLILAGPGAGKTRVVVHRCAYLLRVERIAASRILVLCFNHNAAVDLRKRINALVGNDARGVTVATYHGAAMRLAGISLREMLEHRSTASIPFDTLIKDATALLSGEKEVPGLEPDDMRDQLLQGFSHILVDEYQDIDQDQYDLVSAIAGRSLNSGEGRLAIMAVGDDDQNVYAFRGTNVAFIQRFKEDYAQSKTVYMVENFRSSGHIIAAANQLIASNRDRMKGDHPIRINRRRKNDPPGGPWETMDVLARGRVQQLEVNDATHQAQALFEELLRLKSLQPSMDWDVCAVLARTNRMLSPVRALFEETGIPVKRRLESSLPLHRVREIRRCIQRLTPLEADILPASEIRRVLADGIPENDGNPWSAMLEELIDAYVRETSDAQLPVRYFADWLYEALAELRREKTLGKGIFLNTIHGAKGLEFEHVFILDGDWPAATNVSQQEEERRLLYVGMTRAKETLCLLRMNAAGSMQWMADRLTGPWMLHRRGARSGTRDTRPRFRHYQVVDLKDIFLSYAGRFPQSHPIHARLTDINPGDRLQLAESGTIIKLCCPDGFPVAALSREGSRYWAEKREHILEIRVLGMVCWDAESTSEEYRSMAMAGSWELPLMEVVFDL